MVYREFILLVAIIQLTYALRINFTSCQQTEWNCPSNIPSDIVYNCAAVRTNVSTFIKINNNLFNVKLY